MSDKKALTKIDYADDFSATFNNRTLVDKEYVDNATSGVSATDLAVANITPTTLDVTSSTGTDATLSQATTSNAGLLSASDKQSIDDTFINILIFG